MQSSQSTEIDQACDTIGQLMEPCEKCGRIATGARLLMPGDCEIVLCRDCYADRESLVEWLAAELDRALAESNEFEKLPDGNWRRRSDQ